MAIKLPWTKALPCTSSAYVLFMGKEVVYVGSTIRLRARVQAHPHLGKFDSILWFALPPVELESAERALYEAFNPSLNVRKIRRDETWAFNAAGEFRSIRDCDRPHIPHDVFCGRVVVPTSAKAA